MNHYIYFLQEVSNNPHYRGCKKLPVKIGMTHNIKRRIETLQTGNPRKLKLIAMLGPYSRGKALMEEAMIHKRLTKFRICGEWFWPGCIKEMSAVI